MNFEAVNMINLARVGKTAAIECSNLYSYCSNHYSYYSKPVILGLMTDEVKL